MRQARWIVLLAVALVVPQPAKGQGFGGRPEMRITALMDQLREQMWVYRQELDFFQRAPEYNHLVEQRYHLRNKAIEIAKLVQTGPNSYPAQRELAREMEETARDMFRVTRQLENRTDLGARDEVRRRADLLTEQAVEIRVLIGRWQEVVGMEHRGYRQGQGAYPQPGRPIGVPGGPNRPFQPDRPGGVR